MSKLIDMICKQNNEIKTRYKKKNTRALQHFTFNKSVNIFFYFL